VGHGNARVSHPGVASHSAHDTSPEATDGAMRKKHARPRWPPAKNLSRLIRETVVLRMVLELRGGGESDETVGTSSFFCDRGETSRS